MPQRVTFKFPVAISLCVGDKLITLPTLTSNSLWLKWYLRNTPTSPNSKRMCSVFFFSTEKMLIHTELVRGPKGPLCQHSVRTWREETDYFQSTTGLANCSLAAHRTFHQRILPCMQVRDDAGMHALKVPTQTPRARQHWRWT